MNLVVHDEISIHFASLIWTLNNILTKVTSKSSLFTFFLISYQLSWSNLHFECANFEYFKFLIHFTALLLPIDNKLRKVTCQSMNISDKLWYNSKNSMIFLLRFWMNALNMKQMEHRLKFPWLNLIKKLKTILLFLYLSLIFSISTCRIVPRPKGMVVLHENIFKKYLLIKVILAFWFFYAKNYTREPRPCGLIYLVSRQEGTWPENLRVYCSWSYLGSPRRFSLVLYKEPQLLRRSNERIQLFQQTVRCSKEFPSPPFLWKQKKINAAC